MSNNSTQPSSFTIRLIVIRCVYVILLLSLWHTPPVRAEMTEEGETLRRKIYTSEGKEKVEAYNQLCRILLEENDYLEAAKMAAEAVDHAKKWDNIEGLATAYDMEGLAFQANYDYVNAMSRFMQSLEIRENLKDQAALAVSRNHIGKIFFLQGELDNAIENFNIALQTRENVQDFTGAAETHQNLGDTYYKKRIYGRAKDHFKRALDLQIQLENFDQAAILAAYLGKIATDFGDYEGALVYHTTALDLHNSLEDTISMANDYNNIALVHHAQGEYEEALEANQVARSIREELDDQLGLAETFKNLGLIYTEKGGRKNRKRAKKYLGRAAGILSNMNGEPNVHDLYKAIAIAYEKLEDYTNAYAYHILYAKSKDVYFSHEKIQALHELEAKYQSDIRTKKQNAAIQQLELEQANAKYLRWFLLTLLCLVGIVSIGMFIGYRSKKKDNKLLRTKNEEIRHQKAEIDKKNKELEQKNVSLDILNNKLMDEMSERESIEQSSFARDRFLATMSHEMRTPINGIMGLTHLLLDENPRTDQREHLRNLQFSANNLTVFINDILDFSKIEVGKLTLESRVFEPKNIFNEIYERFKKPIESKRLNLYYSFDERIPAQLKGDPARLNQIVNNLLTNAMEHTKRGNVKLNIYLDEFDDKEAILKIVVTDTGKGINKKMLNKMFQKVAGNANDIFEGYERTGLALAITKRLIDLQNGKMDVETIANKGTVFTIYIPCKLVTEAVQPKAKKAKTYKHFKNTRILIVEDNKINQLVVAKMLDKLGVETVTADNGQEAVYAVEEMDFDLILMDIQMPIMDGYKATTHIRGLANPTKNSIPIIALTASAFLSETEKAKLFGMNDHVGKPFGTEDLIEKIDVCLKTRDKKVSAQG